MLLHKQSLARYCSFKVGGVADLLFIPENLDDLIEFLKTNKKPILMLGLGSNLLVRDNGFDGVVVKLSNFKNLSIKERKIYADAGVSLAKLARFALKNSLNGAGFLSVIPGNVGGGLAMNAGCWGDEIWDFVDEVKTINSVGEVFIRQKNDFKADYRLLKSRFQNEFFIGANFNFKTDTEPQDLAKLLKKRQQTQPQEKANCGSVFKNPNGLFAAKLIEDSGLSGVCRGGACISKKHTNFIINQNNATASEIENLIKHIQKTVKSKFKIDLEMELKII